jgi:hypothetical protein
LILFGERQGLCQQGHGISARGKPIAALEGADCLATEMGTLGELLLGETGRRTIAPEEVRERW